MSIFLDIQHAAFTVDKIVHADGSLSLSVEDLESMAKVNRRAIPARDKIHTALLGMGFTRGAGARYRISRPDFEALCAKTREV